MFGRDSRRLETIINEANKGEKEGRLVNGRMERNCGKEFTRNRCPFPSPTKGSYSLSPRRGFCRHFLPPSAHTWPTDGLGSGLIAPSEPTFFDDRPPFPPPAIFRSLSPPSPLFQSNSLPHFHAPDSPDFEPASSRGLISCLARGVIASKPTMVKK